MPTQYKCRTEAAAASLDTFLGIMETGLYNQRRASPAASISAAFYNKYIIQIYLCH